MPSISSRIYRPARHFGGSRGVTIWTYSRIINGRLVEFDVTHDGAARETTVRVYPGGGMTAPTHDFTVHGMSARDVERRLRRAATQPTLGA